MSLSGLPVIALVYQEVAVISHWHVWEPALAIQRVADGVAAEVPHDAHADVVAAFHGSDGAGRGAGAQVTAIGIQREPIGQRRLHIGADRPGAETMAAVIEHAR